ncbi:MAG: DoxX family protein [Bacteroidota bacterium]
MNKVSMNQVVGVFTARVLIGLIFLMAGIGKVFKIGVENMYNGYFKSLMKDTFLPDFLLKATAYYTSYIELIAGALLVMGLFRDYALYALASVLIIVTFGHGLAEPIWDIGGVVMRSILLITVLLLPKAWDQWTLDHKLLKR